MLSGNRSKNSALLPRIFAGAAKSVNWLLPETWIREKKPVHTSPPHELVIIIAARVIVILTV